MKKLSNKIILARAKEIVEWYGFSQSKAIRLVIREYKNGQPIKEV